LPGESNIAASSTQFVAPDNDVRLLCFLFRVVRVRGTPSGWTSTS
jgi:hypothetical protein